MRTCHGSSILEKMVFDSPRADRPTTADCPAGVRRLMVIFNPTAGGNRRRRLRATLAALDRHGCAVVLRETGKVGDAEAFAAAASPEDCDVLVVAGGDGTINEAVNGLVSAGSRVPLGIIPLGTANVLAHEIGLPLAPAKVAQALATGPVRRIHLGRAGDRCFLLMAGAGFDAVVVEHVDLRLKRRFGKAAYVWEMLRQSRRYPFPTLSVTDHATGTVHQAATAVALNGRLYGGPFVVVRDGGLTEPRLDMILLKRKGMWNVLRYAVGLATGALADFADVEVLRSTSFTIDGSPAREPVQGDGDIIARLPTQVSIADDSVGLVYPA